MSIILAIETSSELASCALLQGDAVIARTASGVRTHSQSILPMVQELLAEAGMALGRCDAIAFGAGPGSFTGVRTACGIAQGLAFGAGLGVLPVVTLAAMALDCREQTGASDVLAVLDARMGEIYWARYGFEDAWRTLSEPALCAPQTLADLPAVPTMVACGNGFAAYPDVLAAFAPGNLAQMVPHASQIARLGAHALAAGQAVAPALAQPFYLRNKIAFTSAERREINAAKAAA